MNEQSLKPIIEKLEDLFVKFNDKFYGGQLQKPIITVSPDITKGAYGWCTSWKAWTDKEQKTLDELAALSAEEVEALKKDDGFYEINLCAEYLSRPFEQIAETLLHEMVHLYNLQEDVQDTSRGGTYHNKKYKDAAEAHGLTVEKDKKYGWNKTKLNDDAKAYVDSLQDKKFQLYRKIIPVVSGTKKSKQSSRKYVCPGCGCIIRATKEVHVVCGDCEMVFEEE
ncbi:MAG: SprT-like domain-containing protein [Clostridia bacterium]|nr:SprT-like domain-containing protein [Clostridia bacterium]